MSTSAVDLDKIGDPARGSRLDCWKEIAAFLGRSEKTVRRWETDRGLPIHRAPGAGRTAVYAFTAELEQWLKSGRSDDADPPANNPRDLPARTPPATLDATPSAVAPHRALVAESDSALTPRPPVSIIRGKRLLITLTAAAAIAAVAVAVRHRSLIAGTPPSRVLTAATTSTASHSADPHLRSSDTEKTRAHEFYLKGRYEWNQRTPDSLNRALDDFTQAVVHDPNDARSYAGLADTYNLLHIYSTLPLTESFPRAIAAAKRAVALDDSLAEAHRALAFAEFYGAGDWVASEREFRRAIQLDPRDPITRRWYGNAFAMPGRFEQSMQQFDKAQELDPASHSTLCDKGIVLVNFGRREEGIALLKNVERTDPGFYSSHIYLMQVAFETRDYSTFFDEGAKAAAIRNDTVLKDTLASAREGYRRNGENGLLQNFYAKQREYYVQGKLPGGILAITCVAMGRREEAIQLLEADYTRHEADALWCLTDPLLRSLNSEPRYKDLVRNINFPGPIPASAEPSTHTL